MKNLETGLPGLGLYSYSERPSLFSVPSVVTLCLSEVKNAG